MGGADQASLKKTLINVTALSRMLLPNLAFVALELLSLLAGSDGFEWIVGSNASYAEAMHNLSSGDIVTLADGVYSGKLCCGQLIRVSNVTIRAQNSDKVTIDCVSQYQHFNIIAVNVSVQGIALINGFSTKSGGCVSGNVSGISFKMCRLENCATLGNGGGMWLGPMAAITLQSLTIQSSTAINGGAIYASSASSVTILEHFMIRLNSASGYGGGLYIGASTVVKFNVTDSMFFSNTASVRGGAFYAYTLSNIVLSGNISLTGNTVTSPATSAAGGAMFATQSSILIPAGSSVRFQDNTCVTGAGGALALYSGSSWLAFGDVDLVGGCFATGAIYIHRATHKGH